MDLSFPLQMVKTLCVCVLCVRNKEQVLLLIQIQNLLPASP